MSHSYICDQHVTSGPPPPNFNEVEGWRVSQLVSEYFCVTVWGGGHVCKEARISHLVSTYFKGEHCEWLFSRGCESFGRGGGRGWPRCEYQINYEYLGELSGGGGV